MHLCLLVESPVWAVWLVCMYGARSNALLRLSTKRSDVFIPCALHVSAGEGGDSIPCKARACVLTRNKFTKKNLLECIVVCNVSICVHLFREAIAPYLKEKREKRRCLWFVAEIKVGAWGGGGEMVIL